MDGRPPDARKEKGRPGAIKKMPRTAGRGGRGRGTRHQKGASLWSHRDSNPGPLACHASALPTELWPRCGCRGIGSRAHLSGWFLGLQCALHSQKGDVSALRSVAVHFTKICGRNTGRRCPYNLSRTRLCSPVHLAHLSFLPHGSCTRRYWTNGTGRRRGGGRAGPHDRPSL